MVFGIGGLVSGYKTILRVGVPTCGAHEWADTEYQRRINEIYRATPAEGIPWNNEQPPQLLVELVESGKIRAGRTLDLGCGLGNYALWLAGKGFDVVGVDASTTAIKKAKQKAKDKKVKCEFLVADVTDDWPDWGGPFDFAYDWGLLHHILPDNREKYVGNVHRVLKPGGKYLSLCFNEKDSHFNVSSATTSTVRPRSPQASSGQASSPQDEKYRKTKLGTMVYLSSEEELQELFGRYFEIIESRVFEAKGKVMSHVFNYFFMERKSD